MKEIYELKNEVDRLKQKVKDQDNDVSDKANSLCWNTKTRF